jgi:hypothetical protein
MDRLVESKRGDRGNLSSPRKTLSPTDVDSISKFKERSDPSFSYELRIDLSFAFEITRRFVVCSSVISAETYNKIYRIYRCCHTPSGRSRLVSTCSCQPMIVRRCFRKDAKSSGLVKRSAGCSKVSIGKISIIPLPLMVDFTHSRK